MIIIKFYIEMIILQFMKGMFNLEVKMYDVTEEFNNQRLDKVIPVLDKDLTRNTVQRMIEEENVLVNGKKEKASYKVKISDKITIKKEDAKESLMVAENIPLNIIYEDNDILIVNKEKGMVVHPRKWKSKWNFSKCSTFTL